MRFRLPKVVIVLIGLVTFSASFEAAALRFEDSAYWYRSLCTAQNSPLSVYIHKGPSEDRAVLVKGTNFVGDSLREFIFDKHVELTQAEKEENEIFGVTNHFYNPVLKETNSTVLKLSNHDGTYNYKTSFEMSEIEKSPVPQELQKLIDSGFFAQEFSCKMEYYIGTALE